MKAMKAHLAIILVSVTSAGAFTVVPRTQCVAPPITRLFYQDDKNPLPPAPNTKELSQAPSESDIRSTEDEVLTPQDVMQIRSIVKGLCSIDDPKALNDIAISNRDLDVEEYDDVITPTATRVFQPLSFVVELVAKNFVRAKSDGTEAKRETESIFNRLSELLDETDQLFYGADKTLGYERYSNHPEVSLISCA